MQRREKRAERLILRAVERFKVDAILERSDGSVKIFEGFRSSPTYAEGTEFGRRTVASFQLVVTNSTFNELKKFAGPDAFFKGEKIRIDGETYRLDDLTPFEAFSLEAGYRFNIYKVAE